MQLDKYRSPAWRYETAISLLDAMSAGVPGPPADEWCHQLAWLLTDSSEFLSIDHVRVFGGVGEAYKLFKEREESKSVGSELYGSSVVTLELETMILANAKPITICHNTGLNPLTVDAYEKLFFDIRDRLNMTSWVCGHVLEPLRVVEADKKVGLDILLPRLIKAYGYLAKNYNLAKLFLRTIDPVSIRRSARSGGVYEAAFSDLMGTSVQQAVLAARMVDPSNPKAYRSITEMFIKIAECAREKGAEGSDNQEVFSNAIQKLFSAVDWQYAKDPTQPVIIPSEVLQLDSTPALQES